MQPRLLSEFSIGSRGAQCGEWVMLAYRVPRTPSTPRIAIWRRLKRMGVAQLNDGLVALPLDGRTREALEWIADDVVAVGGEASVWIARPASLAQERALAARMAEAVASEYQAVSSEATSAGEREPWLRRRTLARLRRELHRTRRRDFFPPPEREQAEAAVAQLAATLEEAVRR
ncbi:MAG: chromate resistance protein [Thermoleophilia bacterium]|nr:chromate resistance protein [Thermoleophilia bacterium]